MENKTSIAGNNLPYRKMQCKLNSLVGQMVVVCLLLAAAIIYFW